MNHLAVLKPWKILDNTEIKSHVYGKPQKWDSSWEFLKIENKQIKTVQNNSFG